MPTKRKTVHDNDDDDYAMLMPDDKHTSFFMTPLCQPREMLDAWEDSTVYCQGLCRIITHQDSESAVVHACLNAVFHPYREGALNSVDVSQVDMVRMFRKELAIGLTIVPDPEKRPDVQYVHLLSDGAWVNLPNNDTEQLYHFMANPDMPLNEVMLEHMSNILNIDIYFIEADSRVLNTNVSMFRYKKRRSVIILQLRKHYELMGLLLGRDGKYASVFLPTHPWIQKLYKQLRAQ